MADCFTCDFAKRDERNRFTDRCSGFGNCEYQQFKEPVKATLDEYIEFLNNSNNINKESNIIKEDYFEGFKQALEYIKKWNETE